MGSRGNGRFGTYHSPKQIIDCDKEIKDVRLEEVESSEYFEEKNEFPKVGTPVFIRSELQDKRVCVCDEDSQKIIGFLPVNYHQLYIFCIENKGKVYIGEVTSIGHLPFPYITVDLHAE